jgi:hypothetical protein
MGQNAANPVGTLEDLLAFDDVVVPFKVFPLILTNYNKNT